MFMEKGRAVVLKDQMGSTGRKSPGLSENGSGGAVLYEVGVFLNHFSANRRTTCSENPAKSELLAFSLIRKEILLALAAFPNQRFGESAALNPS